jgi:UDP-N-acetylglucosamine acyltransferase
MHHPTALIHQGAHIGSDVSIGPFAIIEDGVVIGDRCSIAAHAQILSGVIMGPDNHVDRAAILGGNPQSLSFDTRIPSGVRIGDHNTVREHVTVHRSMHEAGHTSIGNGNFLMATSHVGHDCTIGNRIVIANAVLVAGHVDIADHCFLGGGSAFHQFIRIGTYAMVQGNGSFSCDIPPFCTADGNPARARGLNIVGLQRAGFTRDQMRSLREAFRKVYRSGLNNAQAVEELRAGELTPEAAAFTDFVATTKRGIIPGGKNAEDGED